MNDGFAVRLVVWLDAGNDQAARGQAQELIDVVIESGYPVAIEAEPPEVRELPEEGAR